MKVTTRQIGPVTVLDVDGKMISGEDHYRILDNFVRSLVSGIHRKLLLNLGKVKKVDDGACGELEQLVKDVYAGGGRLEGFNTRKVSDGRLAAKLSSVCRIHEDEASGIRSLAN